MINRLSQQEQTYVQKLCLLLTQLAKDKKVDLTDPNDISQVLDALIGDPLVKNYWRSRKP